MRSLQRLDEHDSSYVTCLFRQFLITGSRSAVIRIRLYTGNPISIAKFKESDLFVLYYPASLRNSCGAALL